MKNQSTEQTPDPPFHAFNHPPPAMLEGNRELMVAAGSAVGSQKCALSVCNGGTHGPNCSSALLVGCEIDSMAVIAYEDSRPFREAVRQHGFAHCRIGAHGPCPPVPAHRSL